MKRGFTFFGNKLSRKAGEKCCEFGQNGLPLSNEYLQDFFNTASEQMKYWRLVESNTMITHAWFVTDYLKAVEFMLEVAKLDANNVLKQQPNMYILRKELLKIELTTPKLKGLSNADLALAVQICLLPQKDYGIIPVMDEKTPRRELRMKQTEKMNNS
jgi:pterin-4a-carbinolamine dehydratase